MPRKPKRPCSHPGCPKLTDGRFCDEHSKQENKRYEKYDRNPAVRRRYGRAWKRIRDRHISVNPLCEECKNHGKLTPAEEVHHIIPLSRGGTHAYDNLMSLCKSCHSEITARDGDRWNNSRGVIKSLHLSRRATGVGFRVQKSEIKRGINPQQKMR